MSESVKHYIDLLVPFVTALATIATPILAFLTSLLGAVWYSIRIYDWLKGKKNADVRND
jgi:hypothetical protein